MALPPTDANAVPVRDAATVILLREPHTNPSVLMGQRGKMAAFMPDKYVFPGGAVDPGDAGVLRPEDIPQPCRSRLAAEQNSVAPEAIATAAIRELWEETGLRLARTADWDAPDSWAGFAGAGQAPDAAALRFFFRAVTPLGPPRRFDARFFIADAAALADDPDDFSRAEDELKHLRWVPLTQVRTLNLPFITQIVLGELETHLPSTDAPARVPFVTDDRLDRSVIWL